MAADDQVHPPRRVQLARQMAILLKADVGQQHAKVDVDAVVGVADLAHLGSGSSGVHKGPHQRLGLGLVDDVLRDDADEEDSATYIAASSSLRAAASGLSHTSCGTWMFSFITPIISPRTVFSRLHWSVMRSFCAVCTAAAAPLWEASGQREQLRRRSRSAAAPQPEPQQQNVCVSWLSPFCHSSLVGFSGVRMI